MKFYLGIWTLLFILIPCSLIYYLKKVRYFGKLGTFGLPGVHRFFLNLAPLLAPPNIAPVAEALIGLYIIIFSGAILGGAHPITARLDMIGTKFKRNGEPAIGPKFQYYLCTVIRSVYL